MDKRTGSTTSMSSESSSSTSISGLPSTSKLIEFSVDDVFARYTVPQVQKLHNEYNRDITKAKDELHQLVGGKYRDLIRIAEEIETMHISAQKMDNALVDLSFANSKFVAFGNNRFSKFDSQVRAQNVSDAQRLSKNTILNNVINNELIGYDLKLQTDSLKKTQSLVHLARIYFTIDKLFADVLSSQGIIKTTYTKLKQNLTIYLEKKLALYTSNGDTPAISTKESTLGSLIESNEEGQWLEAETFDFLSEEYDNDDDYHYSDRDSSKSDLSSSGSNTPIINYLLAYIIIRQGSQNADRLESVAAKLVRLKTDHLRAITEEAMKHPAVSNISFFKILRGIEATAICINELLVNDGELKTRLNSQKSWKASQLIGFHNWFEKEDIHFDLSSEPFEEASYPSLLQAYHAESSKIIENFVKEIFVSCSRSNDIADRNKTILSVLHNLISGINKLKALASYEERTCYVLESINTVQMISDLTNYAIKNIGGAAQDFLSELTEGDSSVLASVKDSLLSFSSDSSHENNLFSENFMQSMDASIETYLESVSRVANFNNQNDRDSKDQLSQWLHRMKNALSETSAQDRNALGRIKKQLEKTASDDSSTQLSEIFDEKVSQLNSSIYADISKHMVSFSESLFALAQDTEKRNKDLNLGVVNYLLNIQDFFDLSDDSINTSELQREIEHMIGVLFENILTTSFKSSLGNISLRQRLQDAIKSVPETASVVTVQKANISVSSLLFGLVEELLDSDRFEQQKIISLLLHKKASSIFGEKKNEALLESISQALDLLENDRLPSENSTEDSQPNLEENVTSDGIEAPQPNPENNSESTPEVDTRSNGKHDATSPSSTGVFESTQLQQVLANIIYVINLTIKDTTTASEPTLQPYLKRLNDLCDKPLEESIVKQVVKGVNEQFVSTKELLLPLSVT